MRYSALLAVAHSLAAQQLPGFDVHLASGRAAAAQSRYVEAERELRLAIDDKNAGARIVEALETLCDLDLLIGKYAEAIELQERAVASFENERELSPHLVRLAGAYRAGGKPAPAIPVLVRAIQLDTAALGADDARVAFDQDALAGAYVETREYPLARAAWKTALDARIRRLGEEHLEVSTTYVNLAVLEEKRRTSSGGACFLREGAGDFGEETRS